MSLGEVHHRTEEWRQDRVEVTTCCGLNPAGDECRAVFRLPDETIDFLYERQRNVAAVLTGHSQHDRQLAGSAADQANHFFSLLNIRDTQSPAKDYAAISRVCGKCDFGIFKRHHCFYFKVQRP